MAKDYLFGEVKNFRCDPAALRDFYEQRISPQPSQPYLDNGASYAGWAITSRDGSLHDGVQQISLKGTGPNAGAASARTAVRPTALCDGPVARVLLQLHAMGLRPFRVRVMALQDSGFEMEFHRDASKESWRLHVPIVTNEGAFFEWRVGETLVRKHLPADGRAWFVRVDRLHRAVNELPGKGTRVHLLMSLLDTPAPHRLGEEAMLLPTAAA